MPQHRFSVYFEDESPDDREGWDAWVQALPDRVKEGAQRGERRPLFTVAAPFPGRDPIATPRTQEVAGLEVARILVDHLVALSRSTGRTVRMLLSGRPVGSVRPLAGADADITEMLHQWQTLLAARPPDEPEWEREGWVSVWAGMVSSDEMARTFEERYGTDGPISSFARSLRIRFYDHDSLEWNHLSEPVTVRVALGHASFAASFVDKLPTAHSERLVNAVAVLYDADFSERPRDAARRRLTFIGSFPYRPESIANDDN